MRVRGNSGIADELTHCRICPRECGVDRAAGELGYCRTGAGYEIGSVCVHRGEEPAISGPNGICNIFFTRCNLQCVYCQNHQISRNEAEVVCEELKLEDLVARVEAILDRGVTAVGFVSATHVTPQMRAIIAALSSGRPRPVFVMNTGGYDKADTLRAVEHEVDVFLPDFKYADPDLAERYSGARDYPPTAVRAIREMARQKGTNIRLDEAGAIESGLIIRHLVLPGHVENSKRVLRIIAEEISPDVHISLMAQYHPTIAVEGHPCLGRRLTLEEYGEVTAEMERLGFHRGWTQGCAAAASYRPDFAAVRPFGPRDNRA